MYRFHAAHEDTVVFPAWKKELSAQAYDEMREHFVQVQQKMIGADGFEDALKKIEGIEHELGILNLAKQTMPTSCKRVDGTPAC
jgi:phosphoglycolate phosphatase-like HAD superfamily hydrolase